MAVKILVATPITSFGELIRSTLDTEGDFDVKVYETGNQVLEAMSGGNFDILILDAGINDQPFPSLVRKIVASVPNQKIAVIPPDNKPDHPLLENVPAHGFLFRPFLDPDLFNLVQRLAAAARENPTFPGSDPSGGFIDEHKSRWTENPAAAEAELGRLLLGSSALAGIITRNDDLYIHAGRISEEASREIAQMLAQAKNDREKDLVRFTFLVADDCEALVYGTSLAAGWNLALVYDVSMPVTRVRSQAASLASRLREQMPLEDFLGDADGEIITPVSEPVIEEDEDGVNEVSDEVDISAIMQEINAKSDSGGDEFLNLNALDDELISLINDLNAPVEEEKEVEPSPAEKKPAVVDKIYTSPLRMPPSMAAEAAEDESRAIETAAEPENSLEEPSTSEVVNESEDILQTTGITPESPETEAEPVEAETEEEIVPTIVDEEIQELAEGPLANEVSQAVEPAFQEVPVTQVVDVENESEIEEPAISAPSFSTLIESLREEDLPPSPLPEGQGEMSDTSLEEAIEAAQPFVEQTGQDSAEEQPDLSEEGMVAVEEPSSESVPPTSVETSLEFSLDDAGEHKSDNDQQFTLVFAPGRSGQYLTGEMVNYLGTLLKSGDSTFPWKLTGVAIRPDYLRLSIAISPYLEPTEIFSFIKDFTAFAISKKSLPVGADAVSETFWAEEHLIIPERTIPEGGTLREFLRAVKQNILNSE